MNFDIAVHTQENQAMSNKSRPNTKQSRGNMPRPVGDLIGKVMEPVLARRSGMTTDLLNAWSEIAGKEFCETTRPERINWPRRAYEDDPFEPATLIVACNPASALFFQHDLSTILERINFFFGFEAIKRIQIVQKPILPVGNSNTLENTSEVKTELNDQEEAELQKKLEDVDNDTLKETLAKLGRGIISHTR